MPQRVLQVERRRAQILKPLDHLRRQVATKSPKDSKALYHYENSRRTWEQLSYLLESELSLMDDPGEYELLPVAVVADELGLSIETELFIGGGEITADGKNLRGNLSKKLPRYLRLHAWRCEREKLSREKRNTSDWTLGSPALAFLNRRGHSNERPFSAT